MEWELRRNDHREAHEQLLALFGRVVGRSVALDAHRAVVPWPQPAVNVARVWPWERCREGAVHISQCDAETIQAEGYPYPTFRCGRGTGFSFLEEPQSVVGNKTVLEPGMVFAVDGGASANNFRSQVGDSFIICLLYTSPSPRDLSTSRMPSSA